MYKQIMASDEIFRHYLNGEFVLILYRKKTNFWDFLTYLKEKVMIRKVTVH